MFRHQVKNPENVHTEDDAYVGRKDVIHALSVLAHQIKDDNAVPILVMKNELRISDSMIVERMHITFSFMRTVRK